MTPQVYSFLSIALTVVSFVPYVRSIHRGQTRPHVFSWVIWALTTLIVFFAQLADRGGAGAWPTGVSGVITVYVAALAYWKNPKDPITRMDWIFFGVCLATLPLWYWTRDPFWAVVVLTTVDTLGFGPTFRKVYHSPQAERLSFYAILIVRNLLSIAALEHFSWTTILFPAVVSLVCVVFIAVVAVQRTRR